MNKDKLREEIAEDEGCKYEVYLDHLGLPTCGIGHLITEADEEHGKPVGSVVEQERVKQLFALDMAVTLDECRVLYDDFDDLPESNNDTGETNSENIRASTESRNNSN